MRTLQEVLRQKREDAGLTLEASFSLGCAANTLSEIERGNRRPNRKIICWGAI